MVDIKVKSRYLKEVSKLQLKTVLFIKEPVKEEKTMRNSQEIQQSGKTTAIELFALGQTHGMSGTDDKFWQGQPDYDRGFDLGCLYRASFDFSIVDSSYMAY